tara:strand:+ start:346 stop:564 length:219 start_codon:yes stop_codon:yes gene_type:complete
MYKNILFLFCLLLVIDISIRLNNNDYKKALDECIYEVSNKCSMSIDYAILLEKENSVLNKKFSNCRNSLNKK